MKKLNTKWLILPLMALAVCALLIAGCSGNNGDNGTSTVTVTRTQTTTQTATDSGNTGLSGAFKIIGSNTVEPLSVVWAEAFMAANPGVRISVSGPGSGVGIAALIDGTTDIAQASRSIKQSEIDSAKANGYDPYETVVATDALSVIVHPSNPVSELSIPQLSAIFTGQITNWSEVGGNDADIVVLSRDTNSGTHVFFKEHVVQMDGLDTEDTSLEYSLNALFLPSTEQGVTEVADNENAIFYPGLGYLTDDVKALAIKKTDSDMAYLPSVETALNGTYPIARSLYYYTDGAPTDPAVKAYIDYCLSTAGQAKVTDVGYVPVK